MNTNVDFTFPHRFACEVLDELPGAPVARQIAFPGDKPGGQDGVIVHVRPESADPWIGLFAFGRIGEGGASCVLSMPDPDKLCVVARGAGYVVSASVPGIWEAVRAVPVIDVRAIPAAGLVVFANYTEMLAYDLSGVRWRTRRLAWDGFKVVAVGEQVIAGEYWDIRDDAMRTFEVDLETGAARGGVES